MAADGRASLRAFEVGWLAYGFLRELVVIYPVYAIMMGESGTSPFELSVLFIVWSLSVVLLEVPSGTLADRYSRKLLVTLAGLVKACCFFVWWWWPEVPGFLLGFVLWGVGSSLRSGAAESLLHDTLAEAGRQADFERIYGRGRAAETCGVGLSFLLGGWLAEGGFETPLLLSGLGPIAAAVVALVVFEEPPRMRSEPAGAESQASEESTYLGLLRSGLREARSRHEVRQVIALMSSGLVVGGCMDEYIGPLLDEVGELDLRFIGIAFALIGAGAGLGGWWAHRVASDRVRTSALVLLASGLLALAALLDGWFLVFGLVGCFFVFEVASVRLSGQLQRRIDGQARATVTSVAGLGQETVGILLYLAAGVAAELGGFGWVAVTLGGIGVVLALGFLTRSEI